MFRKVRNVVSRAVPSRANGHRFGSTRNFKTNNENYTPRLVAFLPRQGKTSFHQMFEESANAVSKEEVNSFRGRELLNLPKYPPNSASCLHFVVRERLIRKTVDGERPVKTVANHTVLENFEPKYVVVKKHVFPHFNRRQFAPVKKYR